MSKFKVGDKVSAVHHAWSKTFNGSQRGKRVHRRNDRGELQEYQVVAVDCKITINMSATANTLIENINTSDLIAINSCNLMPYVANIGVQFMSAGRDVTDRLSDESKKEILRAHLRSTEG